MLDRFELFTSHICDIYWTIQKIEREEMEHYGLKGPHVQCLVALSSHSEGITAARLSELCEKDKAAISRTVAELVQQGLVVRSGGGYRASLCLTEQGRVLAREVNEKAQRAVLRAGQGLTDDDRAVLYAALATISANLKTISKEGLEP